MVTTTIAISARLKPQRHAQCNGGNRGNEMDPEVGLRPNDRRETIERNPKERNVRPQRRWRRKLSRVVYSQGARAPLLRAAHHLLVVRNLHGH